MLTVWDLSDQICILVRIIARIIRIPSLDLLLDWLLCLLLIAVIWCYQYLLHSFFAILWVRQGPHANDSFLFKCSRRKFIILLSQIFLISIDFLSWNWVLTIYILKFHLVLRIDLCVRACDDLFLRIHDWLQWTRIWLIFKL